MAKLKDFAKYVAIFLIAIATSSIFWNINQYLLFRDVSYTEDYDYVVYMDDGIIKVKNGVSGKLDFTGQNFTQIINYMLRKDNLRVFIQRAEYNVTGDILLENLASVKILSNGAKLNLNGHTIIIRGESWENSKHNQIEGLTIANGGLIIENSFMTIIRDCIFINPVDGITVINSNGWTECTAIEHCYFIDPLRRGIVFKMPENNGTKSYANTEIKQCYFELRNEGAIGVHVEPNADFNEGLIQNARFWMGAVSEFNQTGIFVEGSMLNTILQNVVFESFAIDPQSIYGMKLGEYCDPPILGHGVVFCGNLSGCIFNPHGKWVYAAGGSFKVVDVNIPVGLGNSYSNAYEIGAIPHLSLAISSLNVKLQVEGNFSEGEVVYVRLRLKFIDGNYSKHLEIRFNKSESLWLGNEEWLEIWPTRHAILALVVDAKSTAKDSKVSVKISAYGQYG
ncbi:MAG: hypothetical protein QXQ41_04730 [Candidatus Bathyarchaeia archaeon]